MEINDWKYVVVGAPLSLSATSSRTHFIAQLFVKVRIASIHGQYRLFHVIACDKHWRLLLYMASVCQ